MTKTLKLFSLTLLLNLAVNLSFSQTTYVWNGSVSNNFSAAQNWTPLRQIGLNTDILVFENGGNVNAINVYQVTIGQLIIRNNTNLTLSPATGNAKLLTIKGAEGEDLVIENGSGLKVTSTDPALNVYLGTGATASINGNVIFDGTLAHYLNAADEMALRFKQGSTFTQLCPGNIFNTTGVNNAVVFENGSVCTINNPMALNPFGISAPNSKVLFENSSSLIISNISSLQLSGRTFSDLVIEQGTNININESFVSDVTINDLTVKQGASFEIKNTNSNYTPNFKINGNLVVNGSFKFTENPINKMNVVFSGNSAQNISGNGTISFPKTLNKFELQNTISLQRDLAVYCRIVRNNNQINLNGYQFTFNQNGRDPLYSTENAPVNNSENVDSNPLNSNIPSEFSISQNYPNPFNPSTKINFSIPVDSKVNISVYDITGKKVTEIINKEMNAGYHTVDFSANELSSGVYFYTINAGSFTKTMKMVLAK